MNVLVTGGAGFIGSNLVYYILEKRPDWKVLNLDALTYAGNLENLKDCQDNPNYSFVQADITHAEKIEATFKKFLPDYIIHLAAESHVDRSILDPLAFVTTNVVGTQVLLDQARKLDKDVRFLYVSTDEVYGSLGSSGFFTEKTPLAPNSPYSASKAAGDMLVYAAYKTHNMDTLATRCSNNYGPYQFPEKLIPLMFSNALEQKELPVYGDGKQIRDWLYVEDHCAAILTVLENGRSGEVYNIGGNNEWQNIDIVKKIIEIAGASEDLIRFVKDRPGHDRRYAIDASKIKDELGWTPAYTFEDGLPKTLKWYKDNLDWIGRIKSGAYLEFYEKQYGKRLS